MAFTSAPAAGHGPNDVPRDSYGRYLIPRYPFDGPMIPEHEPVRGEGMAQPWTRVSTLAKAVQDFEGLHAWKMRLLAKGLASRPDLYVLAASSRLDDRSQLTSIVDQALDAAEMKASSNLGTALHAFTDQVDRGEDVVIPAPWDADIRAYQDALKRNGIELIPGLAEVRIVDPSLKDGKAEGTAGTFDRIVMYQGRPTVADLKTGSDPLKYGAGGISIQLGRYAKAWAMWDGEFFRPMPAGLRTDVALVIHLPAGTGTCEVYEVDLEPGHDAVELCMRVREWRRRGKDLYRRAGSAPAAPSASVARRVAVQAAAEQDCDACPPEDAAHLASAHAAEDAPVPVESFTGKPGGRACSVCRQPGHRKGSPKCPGAPVGAPAGAPTVEQGAPDASRPGSIEEMIEMAQTCTCTGSSGWSVPAWSSRPDVTVCGTCGFPSPAILARVTGERSGLAPAAEPQEPAQDAATDGPPWETDESAFEDDAPAQPAPEPVADPRAELLAELAVADSKAAIRDVRERAKAAGLWDNEMLQAGLARLEELK